jgi:hypothetical protein
MCNKDDLVSYLYDDLSAPARAAFEQHLGGCGECRDELTALRGVRADLLTWSPREPDFAFRIVKEPRAAHAEHVARAQARVLRPGVPSWRAWLGPAAGLAAAAVLVLAAAAGLARVEVHSGPDGWTLRTGAPSAADTVVAGFGRFRPHDVNLSAGEDVMSALERRISALEAASSRETSNVRYASSVQSARASNDEILKVVRELLAQSETRQKGELMVRIQQVVRDMDMKRAADLNGVREGISRIDANVTGDAAMRREMMNYILTNSKQK